MRVGETLWYAYGSLSASVDCSSEPPNDLLQGCTEDDFCARLSRTLRWRVDGRSRETHETATDEETGNIVAGVRSWLPLDHAQATKGESDGAG
jgi:hypothetical protein